MVSNKIPCIYRIRNIVNNKAYIGSTVDFKPRINRHLSMLKRNIHHSKLLQNAWNKYGENNFVFEVLFYTVCLDTLVNFEQLLIDTYDTHRDGYNVCPIAGNRLGTKHSELTRIKMSNSHRKDGIVTRSISDIKKKPKLKRGSAAYRVKMSRLK